MEIRVRRHLELWIFFTAAFVMFLSNLKRQCFFHPFFFALSVDLQFLAFSNPGRRMDGEEASNSFRRRFSFIPQILVFAF